MLSWRIRLAMRRHLLILCGIKVPQINYILAREIIDLAPLRIGLARGKSTKISDHLYTPWSIRSKVVIFPKNNNLPQKV